LPGRAGSGRPSKRRGKEGARTRAVSAGNSQQAELGQGGKSANGPKARRGGRNMIFPFSFSEMTFPNTFSNDFQFLLAFG
jgi:hypothetical protein